MPQSEVPAFASFTAADVGGAPKKAAAAEAAAPAAAPASKAAPAAAFVQPAGEVAGGRKRRRAARTPGWLLSNQCLGASARSCARGGGNAPTPAVGWALPPLIKPASSRTSSGTRHAPTNPPTGGRIVASPYAKKLAADARISLAGVPGSGPGGRIVAEDVQRLIASGGARPAAAAAAPGVPAAAAGVAPAAAEYTGGYGYV